jgi:hypothetical protein
VQPCIACEQKVAFYYCLFTTAFYYCFLLLAQVLLCLALIGVALYRVRAKYAEGPEGGEKKN